MVISQPQDTAGQEPQPLCALRDTFVPQHTERNEERCVHSWEPLTDFSPVNLSDSIYVDLKHLKMPVIPKDCSSYCSSDTYLSLSVSFLCLTGVRGDKEEPLYSTVGTIPTRDTLGGFHRFSVAWDVDVGVYSPKAFILVTILLKPIVHFL